MISNLKSCLYLLCCHPQVTRSGGEDSVSLDMRNRARNHCAIYNHIFAVAYPHFRGQVCPDAADEPAVVAPADHAAEAPAALAVTGAPTVRVVPQAVPPPTAAFGAPLATDAPLPSVDELRAMGKKSLRRSSPLYDSERPSQRHRSRIDGLRFMAARFHDESDSEGEDSLSPPSGSDGDDVDVGDDSDASLSTEPYIYDLDSDHSAASVDSNDPYPASERGSPVPVRASRPKSPARGKSVSKGRKGKSSRAPSNNVGRSVLKKKTQQAASAGVKSRGTKAVQRANSEAAKVAGGKSKSSKH
jgi:hypothetical protein